MPAQDRCSDLQGYIGVFGEYVGGHLGIMEKKSTI